MEILILDDKGRYLDLAISLEKDLLYNIDYFTSKVDIKMESKRCCFFFGERNIQHIRSLKRMYDVIIDAGAILEKDIEIIFQYIKTNRYLFFSTYQAYSLIEEYQIMYEDMIGVEEIKKFKKEIWDWENKKKEIYIQERLKTENKLINLAYDKCDFTIFRLSKLYTKEDVYKDIQWIKKRIIEQGKILISDMDIMKNNMFNPIFLDDLIKAVKLFLEKKHLESWVYNISQNELISFGKLAYLIGEIVKKEFDWIVLPEEEIRKYYNEYHIPMGNEKIISNDRWNREMSILYIPTKEWINKILEVKSLDDKRIDIDKRERELILYNEVRKKRFRNFKVLE